MEDRVRDRITSQPATRGLIALLGLLAFAIGVTDPRTAFGQSSDADAGAAAVVVVASQPASLATVEPLAAAPASVSLPPPPPQPDEDAARIRWIQAVLDDGNSYANGWYYFWIITQGVLFVGQTAVAVAVSDPLWRPSMAVGAATALVGGLPMVIFPMDACSAARALRREPVSTADQRQRTRIRAEQLLRASAENEEFGRSWGMHALGWVGSALAGVVLWLGFQQPWNALGTFIFGVVGGELQLLTQPLAAARAWDRYQGARSAADLGRPSASRTSRGVRFVIAPSAYGVGASFTF